MRICGFNLGNQNIWKNLDSGDSFKYKMQGSGMKNFLKIQSNVTGCYKLSVYVILLRVLLQKPLLSDYLCGVPLIRKEENSEISVINKMEMQIRLPYKYLLDAIYLI